eukprot:4369513-Alexandrium_andersonii.AAC.1
MPAGRVSKTSSAYGVTQQPAPPKRGRVPRPDDDDQPPAWEPRWRSDRELAHLAAGAAAERAEWH